MSTALHRQWDRLADGLWSGRPWWLTPAVMALVVVVVAVLPSPWSMIVVSIQAVVAVSLYFAFMHGSDRRRGRASCGGQR